MVIVGFADEKLEKDYKRLGKSAEFKVLFKSILKAVDDLSKYPLGAGLELPKKQIPKFYKNKYGIKNLYKYELGKGWRLMYSIDSNEIEIIAIVLEWFDHKGYEKRMGYKVR